MAATVAQRAVPISSSSNPSISPAAHLSRSPPHAPPIDYASTAPQPPSSSKRLNGVQDETLPTHLYERLPKHLMVDHPSGKGKVPDYLRMILMSKVYSQPLGLTETPLTYAVNLSARFGCEIWLKREDLQPVFSFKIRGAYNLMAHLTAEEKAKGVITCSAGNHAQGVALSAKTLGITATVVMPISTPSIKWRNVERLGGTVVLYGSDFDEAKGECLRLAEEKGLTFVPPYDNPYVVAGQGTIGMEICRQVTDCDELDGVFASIGGGGLVAGIAAYIKRAANPNVKVWGVETYDGDAMEKSLTKGKRVLLDEVGPFADGTAVRIVGEEPFRMCQELVDGVIKVDNDQICAAIKDVFEETRSIPEPSGALALAGVKAHIVRNKLQGKGKRFVAVISGGNMNFDRLRFVAERAELGENREVLMSVRLPERPGSFVKFYNLLDNRVVTEFSYRMSVGQTGHVICSFILRSAPSAVSGPSPEERAAEVGELINTFKQNGIPATDLSENEFAKSHVRHLVGGRGLVEHERLFRFEFPERFGALRNFLHGLRPDWNISLFHYRNHGADVGKVLVGVQVPEDESAAWYDFLQELGYPYVEETQNEAYQMFLTG